MVKNLTCIECPIGCEIEVMLEEGKVVSVSGNGCPRGKLYAEAEVVCPKRVVTSTVRAEDGEMIPVKTDRPVRKDAIFEVMQKINATVAKKNDCAWRCFGGKYLRRRELGRCRKFLRFP